MTGQDKSLTKKRGRPPGIKHADMASIRLPPALSTAIDAWLEGQPEPRPGRSEAIRRLLEHALADGGPKGPPLPASSVAIDVPPDAAAPLIEQLSQATAGRMVKLPKQVAAIYDAVAELSAAYPGRKFTPDGHLVGSIGEVIATEALNLTLHPASYPGHDAHDGKGGNVQIKMTGGKNVAFYDTCQRLVVLRMRNAREAEIVYDGDGDVAWREARKPQKNGQRVISLKRLMEIAQETAAAPAGPTPTKRRPEAALAGVKVKQGEPSVPGRRPAGAAKRPSGPSAGGKKGGKTS